MLYLAFIFHMHQPYYKNLLTQETALPWARLHGVKDYLDMVQILEKYPAIHQTFNLVPSLVEQLEDYSQHIVKDKFLELSYKPAAELNKEEKDFIRSNFFMINKENVIAFYPRYYDLYFKQKANKEFSTQDYLDLQVYFNLSWIDPYFRESIPELKRITEKARHFSEGEKRIVLDKQLEIIAQIIPAYKKFRENKQIELTLSPYYHPILPLVYNTKIAKEANLKSILPKVNFSYPDDVQAQVDNAVKFYQDKFGIPPCGMWPSEQSVSEHILPFIIQAGIDWIVADEAVLFRSLKKKKRETKLLYQSYLLKRKDGNLNIIFRDRNLSDLIGFVYHRQTAKEAVSDFMKHLENINKEFKDEDPLVAIAMDGENAWEYYKNDGHDFLELLYQNLSEAKFLKAVTISEYLEFHSPKSQIKSLASGSWIHGNFNKWMDNPAKAKAWEWLAKAREELESHQVTKSPSHQLELARKQMYICEGSDWFWWYGEETNGDFDQLFRIHLSNFYTTIDKEIPVYLKSPLTT